MGWFFKDKAYEALNDEQKSWLAENKALPLPEKLIAAMDKPEIFNYLFKKNAYDMSLEDNCRVSLAIVEKQNIPYLRMFLEEKGLQNFGDTYTEDSAQTKKLFRAAAQNADIWDILWKKNENTQRSPLNTHDILACLPNTPSNDLIKVCLTAALRSKEVQIIEHLLENPCFVAVPEHFNTAIEILNTLATSKQIIVIATHVMLLHAGNHPEYIDQLIALGANANTDGGRVLVSVLANKKMDAAEKLSKHIDLITAEKTIIDAHARGKIDHEAIEWMSQRLSRLTVEKEKNGIFKLVDEHTLSETKAISSYMALTTLFNFKASQQIVIVERSGQPPALTTTDFADFSNQEYLEEMRQKLLSLNGKAEPFRRLIKNKLDVK